MRATLIVPVHKRRQLLVENLSAKWHENYACTSVLVTQDESLNECNTPMLANSAKAGRDPLTITPILKHVAPELLALVADDVFWFDSCTIDSSFKEMMNRVACRIAH